MLGNRGSLPCRISNVSQSGALVLISNAEWVPNTFELADTFSGVSRQATVVCKGANSIGARFRSGQNWLRDATALISAGEECDGHSALADTEPQRRPPARRSLQHISARTRRVVAGSLC